jgi:hypothetical protein
MFGLVTVIEGCGDEIVGCATETMGCGTEIVWRGIFGLGILIVGRGIAQLTNRLP